MLIIVFRDGFKIRSKEDAKHFLTKCVEGNGEVTLIVSEVLAYKIDRHSNGTICIYMKTGDIHNVFNPDVRIGYYNPSHDSEENEKCIDIVYTIRKHINAHWFNNKKTI